MNRNAVKILSKTENDDLIHRARTDAAALGRLYDLYYNRIYRFCLCRVFSKETAEDITSMVFLAMARSISGFRGESMQDFENWIYAIAANKSNSHIRKTLRRQGLLAQAAAMMAASTDDPTDESTDPDWPVVCAAILKLKPNLQTILVLRFFENLEFEQIARIIKSKPSNVRVMLHRALKQLRQRIQTVLDGSK